jgi:tyrosyl-tRNA synthetase
MEPATIPATDPLIQELHWRGLLHNVTPGLGEHLSSGPRRVYIGFDPTADSLHLGSLATIMLLFVLRKHGHTPVILIGDATATIGDPSGKSAERTMLTKEVVAANAEKVCQQILRIVDRCKEGPEPWVVYNQDWYEAHNVLTFLRETGKHFSVNQMLARDSVASRLETGISFTEFAYQLLQARDFWFLFTKDNITVQMGGSDQWGNMTAGIDYIRRREGKEAHALTMPLLRKADGTKFGKTESGTIWLDAKRTAPLELYQYILNQPDDMMPQLFRQFLIRLSEAETEALLTEYNQSNQKRAAQKMLAFSIVEEVHGLGPAFDCQTTTRNLYESREPLSSLPVAEWETMLKVTPSLRLERRFLGHDNDAYVMLIHPQVNLIESRGDLNRLLKNKGLRLNGVLLQAAKCPDLIHNRFICIQKGKTRFIIDVQD